MSERFNWNLALPQHWPMWLGVGVVWLVSRLPWRVQMSMGDAIGWLLYHFATERRRVVRINIGLCFAELDEAARERLVRDSFREAGRGILDMVNCWYLPEERFARLVQVEGLEHLQQAIATGKGIIALTGHMCATQIGLRALSAHVVTSAVFRLRTNPVLNHVMQRKSRTWLRGRMIDSTNIQSVLLALKDRQMVYYAPDQHPATKFRVPAPFFGRVTMTHAGTSGMAKMSGAVVLPYSAVRRSDAPGYRVEIQPPLAGFPSGNREADAARVNQVIETAVRQSPAQYFWIHARFKRLKDGDVWKNIYTGKVKTPR